MPIVRERDFSREIHQHFFLDTSNVAAFRAELGIPPETDLGTLELGLEQWAAVDQRLTGYRAVLLLSEAPDLGDAAPWPTFRPEDTPGSPTCRLWLWRVRYGEAMVCGEFRWTAGQGALRQVVAPGWTPPVGHEDVLRAWQGLDLRVSTK